MYSKKPNKQNVTNTDNSLSMFGNTNPYAPQNWQTQGSQPIKLEESDLKRVEQLDKQPKTYYLDQYLKKQQDLWAKTPRFETEEKLVIVHEEKRRKTFR
jgi:hypothetical protein